MRIAVVCDIHGNLPAVEAVVGEVRRLGAGALVVAGDVLPGPMVGEVVACLQRLEIPVRFIQGNGEIDALEALAGGELERVPEAYRGLVRWSAEQLGTEYQPLIAGWPKTLRMEIDGFGAVLFCHATPHDDNEIFTRVTPEETLLPIFEGLDVSMVVCGHTHMQFDRTIGGMRVVNAGSVGMPFGEPGADWLLLDDGDVRFMHTGYDLENAAQRIRQTDYPRAHEFAENYVLHPPSAERMLEVYTRAGLSNDRH